MNELRRVFLFGLLRSSRQYQARYQFKQNVNYSDRSSVAGVTHPRSYSAENRENTMNIQNEYSSLIEVTQNFGLDSETIVSAIKRSPKILAASSAQWQTSLNELKENGFSSRDCLGIITAVPSLLRMKSGFISDSVECWRRSNLGDTNLLYLLKTCPFLIVIDSREICRRLPLLRSLASQKNVKDLIISSPNVMLENWNKLLDKIDYVENVMGIDKRQIPKSSVLSKSLLSLKTRHIFLERCGLYAPPKKNRDANEINNNPPLKQIVDTDDEYFATRIAKVSLEEFETFQDMFAQELEDQDENEDGSDSDDE